MTDEPSGLGYNRAFYVFAILAHMDKSTHRARIATVISALTPAERSAKDAAIHSQLLELIADRRATKLCSYTSIEQLGEVDTSKIILTLRQRESLFLTTIEPVTDAVIPLDTFDLILVPVVAFDRAYNRIGRGGGWYDKFLATQPQAYKVGLAYSEQLIDTIDVEQHDIALDTVLYA